MNTKHNGHKTEFYTIAPSDMKVTIAPLIERIKHESGSVTISLRDNEVAAKHHQTRSSDKIKKTISNTTNKTTLSS